MIQITPQLWLAIIMFLAQQMEALFRELEEMSEEEREEWRRAQHAEYDDHMAWLRERLKE